MSLIFVSNLNHVLKRLSLFSNLKTKLKLKFSTWPNVIIYQPLSFLRWCGPCSSKTICYMKKQILFYKEIHFNIEHKVQRK